MLITRAPQLASPCMAAPAGKTAPSSPNDNPLADYVGYNFISSDVAPLFTGLLGLRGLGEYPGYYCYDANRPSWLPYWIDDLTESECKWNPATIVGNIYDCATNDPTCGTPSGAALDPTVSGPGVAAPGQPTNIPKCGQFSTYDPASGQCVFSPTAPASLVAGAAIIGGLVLLHDLRN